MPKEKKLSKCITTHEEWIIEKGAEKYNTTKSGFMTLLLKIGEVLVTDERRPEVEYLITSKKIKKVLEE